MEKKTFELPKKSVQMKKKASGFNAPDFDSMLDPSGLPGLPGREGETAEETASMEVEDMMASIRENRKNRAESFRDIESGEFYFCVCFQTRSQKEEFINALLEKYGGQENTSFGDKYIDGFELAALLDIPVEPIILENKKSRLAPKSLRNMEVI